MAEQHVGLRERKNARTRAAIIRAACELILERGFEGATIAQIAERADVAPRTVHTWFPSKEDIVFAGLDEPLVRLESVLADGEGDTVVRLERWFRDESAGYRHDELTTLRQRAIASDAHLRGVAMARLDETERAIARAVAGDSGAPADGLSARTFAGGVMALLIALRQLSFRLDEPTTLDDLRELALLRGALDALRQARAAS